MHPSGEIRSVSSWVLGHHRPRETIQGPHHSDFDELLETVFQIDTFVKAFV